MTAKKSISNSFTVNTVEDGEDSVTYTLQPSIAQISVGRTAAGGYNPSSVNMRCGYKKSVGGTITSVADPTTDFDGYCIVFRRRLRSTGAWEQYNSNDVYIIYAYGHATSKGLLYPLDVSTYDEVEFYIANVGTINYNGSYYYVNTLVSYVDRTTVPVVEDGMMSVVYSFSLAGSIFSIDDEDTPQLSIAIVGKCFKTEGGETSTYSLDNKKSYLTLYYKKANGDTVTIPNNSYTVSESAFSTTYCNGDDWSNEEAFVIELYSDTNKTNLIASESIQIQKQGTKGTEGARGKVGRFFYYGNVFDSSNNTKQFVVNDAQAPYFAHVESNQIRYHVYNPANNPSGGSLTMAQMWAASNQSWNKAPWQVMTNDFKYLITEALFTDFAKLASAIFNGDWMLSQYGVPTRQVTAEEKYLVYLCVNVDGQYPVSDLATLLVDETLWDEYKDYGYSDSELEAVADVCQWAVAAMPTNTDDVRYNAIQTISSTSYQLFGLNPSNLFSVFAPNISLDFLRGKAYLNDCNVKGNLVGRLSNPLTRIKNGIVWDDYGVIAEDAYGYTRHYLFINRMPTWNVQIEYMSGATTLIRRLILPVITYDTLGTEIKVVNVSGDTLTVEGKPETGTYAEEGSYLLDGIQRTGYSNDTRTIVMEDQTILKFVSVEIPTQSGEYGWIAIGEPQTIKSQV